MNHRTIIYRALLSGVLATLVTTLGNAAPPRLVSAKPRVIQVQKRLRTLPGYEYSTPQAVARTRLVAHRLVDLTEVGVEQLGYDSTGFEELGEATESIVSNPSVPKVDRIELEVGSAPNQVDDRETRWSPPMNGRRITGRPMTDHSTNGHSTNDYPSVSSNQRSGSDVLEALHRTGDITFRNAPLGEVVFVLSDRWHINIVGSDDIEGEVSGSFRGTPLWEVLDSLLLSTGYGYQSVGQSLVILPKDEVDRSAGFTQGVLNSSVDGGGSLPSPSATTGAVASATNAGGHLGNEVAFFSPQYTEAEMLAKPLVAMFEGSDVRVAVYPEENRIMVLGNAKQIAVATNMIEQLDQPRAQVRITALIYDVALKEIRNIGLNVSRDARGIAGLANEGIGAQGENISDFLTASSDLVNGGSSIGLRTINSATSTSLLLDCLSSNSESKLLADPSITVGDRHEASIRIVERIPIITANPVENSNAVFTQTQFEEAGIILNVLPRISRDGTIEMVVKPEFSAVTEILASGPRIDSRTAETTVRVVDGQMFVLGGLRQKRIVENVRGIPFFKDIKYIGRLFQGHATEVRESELIVFLKPEIVSHCNMVRPREDEAYRVGNEFLDRIPYAEDIPLTPCCRDPECPNHHPRIRINPGSEGLIDSQW